MTKKGALDVSDYKIRAVQKLCKNQYHETYAGIVYNGLKWLLIPSFETLKNIYLQKQILDN